MWCGYPNMQFKSCALPQYNRIRLVLFSSNRTYCIRADTNRLYIVCNMIFKMVHLTPLVSRTVTTIQPTRSTPIPPTPRDKMHRLNDNRDRAKRAIRKEKKGIKQKTIPPSAQHPSPTLVVDYSYSQTHRLLFPPAPRPALPSAPQSPSPYPPANPECPAE